MIKKIAHRGYSALYGDNNLISFKKAIENHFDGIELDIRLNMNNNIVIYHDSYINNKLIKELSNDEIIKYKILKLKDFFDKINISNTEILLDLKDDDNLAKELIKFFDKYKINKKNIIVASFNINYLKELKNSGFKLGYTTCNNYTSYNFIDNIDYILVDFNIISEEFIKEIKKKNKIIYCFTCYDKYQLDLLKNYNIDGIISNIKID